MQPENQEAADQKQDTGSKEPYLGSGEQGAPDADSQAADKKKKANTNSSSGDWKRLFGTEWWPTERRRSDNSTVGRCAVRNLRNAHSI
jgi:hypothetical protein